MKFLSSQLEIAHSHHTPLKPMEGLRGIAVFLVFLVHYCSLIRPFINVNSLEGEILTFTHRLGNVGVDLFFVLSGFLIYGTLMKKNKTQFLPYMKRRIRRIYPTFLGVFVVYLLLSMLFPNESKLPKDSIDALLLIIQNLLLLPGLFDIPAIITVAWSLSYEVFYYFVIPCVIGLFKLRLWKRNIRVYFWGILSIAGFIYFELYGGHYRLLMFVAGIILYEFYHKPNIKLPNYSGTGAFILALVAYSLSPLLQLSGTIQTAILYLLFMLLCAESFTRQGGSAVWLNAKYLRWLGNMSYSYYLIHGLTLKAIILVMAKLVEPNNQFEALFWWALPLFFGTTLVVSFILFVTVEKPLSLQLPNK